MKRDEISELHNIQHIGNLASILQKGILSHTKAALLQHESVADPQVQHKRAQVVVAGGLPLHEYANLYINARNSMMYVLSAGSNSKDLCILRVATDVLDFPGVVVTDQNAASGYARFSLPVSGLALLDHDHIFAQYWTHPGDQIAEWRHKAAMCAEVLVPGLVPPQHIIGAYVSIEEAGAVVASAAPGLAVEIKPELFFR